MRKRARGIKTAMIALAALAALLPNPARARNAGVEANTSTAA